MPSATAARVACSASSTRDFFSFISISVDAPTLISATPPASLAARSRELLAVVVAGRLVDRVPDLRDARLDPRRIARAADQRRAVLVDLDPARAAQVGERRLLELESRLLRDHRRRRSARRCPPASRGAGRRSPAPSPRRSCSTPRIELTTSVASASPVTSSAISSSGLPSRDTCSSTGSRSLHGRDRAVVDRARTRPRARPAASPPR